MFLVLSRHVLDDFPVRLFENKAAAIKFAEQLQSDSFDSIKDVLQLSASDPMSISLIEFERVDDESADGATYIPQANETVREFD